MAGGVICGIGMIEKREYYEERVGREVLQEFHMEEIKFEMSIKHTEGYVK